MDAKRKLKGMLARIFSDAVVEEPERAELDAYLASGALSRAEIEDVFEDFVRTTWRIAIADGVISGVERQRMSEIVRVLGLEVASLPADWIAALGNPAEVEWVLLRSFTDRVMAQMLGDFLEKQGIRASVEGSFSAGVLPGVEGVRVMVPTDRLADARQAAEAFDGEGE